MERALQVNSLGFVAWLLSLRPSVVVSLALHIALLLFLTIVLAFPPGDPPAVEEAAAIIEVTPPPQTESPTVSPIFKPDIVQRIERVRTTVEPLRLKAVKLFPPDEADHATVTAVEPPADPKPQAAPRRVVVDPNPISRGGLIYPARAQERDLPGTVDLSFVIEPDGTVGEPRVLAEAPEGYGFAAAALKALPGWRFKPELIDDQPVATPATIRISFKLQ
jgi:protein TonB